MDATYPLQLHDPTRLKPPQSPSQPPTKRRPTFPSYVDTPNLPPRVKLLCQILAAAAAHSTEAALDATGLVPTQNDVEQVLKLSYSFPSAAAVFFRWSGFQLNHTHSPYSWNLVVDLLGKNFLFDPMWDAIKSMRRQRLVSLATFASVFSSYVIAGKVREAVLTFEVMDRYGCARDVVALNTLVSAICRDGRTGDAAEFVRMVKYVIRPDADTYAILLEGWEKELDVVNARQTFAEMVVEIGWDKETVLAYEAFLCTVLLGPDGLVEAVKFLRTMVADRGCHPGQRFFGLALEECLKCRDVSCAELVWETLTGLDGAKVWPDGRMYCMMVALYCYTGNTEQAKKFLDKLVSIGWFLDLQACNLLFLSLINSRKLHEASELFNEMSKRGMVPNQVNCAAAVQVSVDSNNAYLAIKVWQSMLVNYETHLEETGNLLLVGLCDFRMVDEAVRHAEEMIKKGIKLTSSTLSKLKQSLTLERKEFLYEKLLALWKGHQVA